MNLWPFLTIPILTELLTANQPFSIVFSLGGYLFLFFAYSLPALLIHELKVRWGLGVLGLFSLGLAYGIFNEGVLAQTIFLSDSRIPISAFIGYSTYGINVPWSVTILPWHALHSVIYPIALFSTLSPKESMRGRFSKAVLVLMAVFYLVMGSIVFINFARGGSGAHLALCWGVIIGLIALSRILPRTVRVEWPQGVEADKNIPLFKGLLIGCPLILLLIIPTVCAGIHLPVEIQLTISAIMYVFVFWRFRKSCGFHLPFFSVIAIGHYLTHALIATFLVWKDFDRLLGEIVVVIVLGYFLWRVSEQKSSA